MRKAFLEMGFSAADGIHPKGYGIYTNQEGFLFRYSNATGEYKPLKPHLGNSRVIGNRGAYFYFMANGKQYRVNQEDIQEHGLDARPIDVDTKKYV